MIASHGVLLCCLALCPFAATAFEYYKEPDPSLYQFSIGPLPACDYTITSAAQWKNINDSSYRVICVAPGDYRSTATITITSSGTKSAPRWLRYVSPGVSDGTHAYSLPEKQKAIVGKIAFVNASYWIVDRLTLDGTGLDGIGSYVRGSSQFNVFNRLEIRKFQSAFKIQDASHNNWVQNNVLYGQPRMEGAYIGISGAGTEQPRYTKIVSNECWDAGDCIQLSSSGAADHDDFRGTVIYNNDLYQTGAKYTNCAGTYTTSGSCSCSENAIDIKSASDSAAEPVIVAHNRLWGWRYSDQKACPSLSDAGNAIIDHEGVANLRYEGNIFWDNSVDYRMGGDPVENVLIHSNLFHSPGASLSGKNKKGMSVSPSSAINLTIKDNVISTIPKETVSLMILEKASQSASFQFLDNVLIDGGLVQADSPGFRGTASGNRYYNSDRPSWDIKPAAYQATVVGSGYDKEFCTTIKRITNPTKKCFRNALGVAGGSSSIDAPEDLKTIN